MKCSVRSGACENGMRSRSLCALLHLALLCIWVFSNTAYAGDRIVYGVKFPVDEVSEIDSSSVKVRIGPEEEIVPTKELDSFVIQKTFGNQSRARTIPVQEVISFINEAASNGDQAGVAAGLRGLLAHSSGAIAEVSEFLRGSRVRPEIATAIRGLVAKDFGKGIPQVVLPQILLVIAEQEPEWLIEHSRKFSAEQLTQLRDLLRTAALEYAQNLDFKSSDRLLELRDVTADESSSSDRDLRSFLERLRLAAESREGADVERYVLLRGTYKDRAEYVAIISSQLREAVHRFAKENLTEGRAGQALDILSKITFADRTPLTHDLTRRALVQLSDRDPILLERPEVRSYLSQLVALDGEVRAAYLAALERQLRDAVAVGKPEESSALFRQVLVARPDPDRQNDQLRLLCAQGYLQRGLHSQAEQMVNEIRTGLGIKGRIALLSSGYYQGIRNILLSASIAILIFLTVYITRRILVPAESQIPDLPETTVDNEAEADRPGGFAIVSSRLMTPAMLEYNRCLGTLGLQAGAPMSQIKKQYRTLVKKVHPDLNTNLSAADKERFVSLTKTYDRLLELRRELKLGE